ncbi:hypothetical protein DQF64_00785 [Moraxella bovis]|nr:hypothetical protein DQF64_00785 [Moraxella bovis]
MRIANCELRIANCELRIANCELRIANCELRIANCELRIILVSILLMSSLISHFYKNFPKYSSIIPTYKQKNKSVSLRPYLSN